MRHLKTRHFNKWAVRERISDTCLQHAIKEFKEGLCGTQLGQHLFKKRVPISGRGKRGGARTIIFYQKDRKLVFCLGFSKNTKESIGRDEKKALIKISETLLSYSQKEVDQNIQFGSLIEITGE